jgi:hypothetical protein
MAWVRCRPLRSCASSRADAASLLPGSARITIRSAGSRSGITALAICRNCRATRCRCTAVPTDLAITNPIRGPAGSTSSRRTCTTRSDCAARTPCLTVAPNSADRVIRYCAGSNVPTARTESGSQRATAFGAPAGHDRASRASAHPQPETVHACTAPNVRLEGPLALGHGCFSSLHLAFTSDTHIVMCVAGHKDRW